MIYDWNFRRLAKPEKIIRKHGHLSIKCTKITKKIENYGPFFLHSQIK